jgi:hypothetical protein
MRQLIMDWTYYYPLIITRDFVGLTGLALAHVFCVLDDKAERYERESFWGRK